MPWSTDEPSYEERDAALVRMKKEVDELTSMLCAQVKHLKTGDIEQELIIPMVRVWYKKHELVDIERIKKARERLKKLDAERAEVMRELGPVDEWNHDAMGG